MVAPSFDETPRRSSAPARVEYNVADPGTWARGAGSTSLLNPKRVMVSSGLAGRCSHCRARSGAACGSHSDGEMEGHTHAVLLDFNRRSTRLASSDARRRDAAGADALPAGLAGRHAVLIVDTAV